MGKRKAPTTYIPTPAAPTLFRSVIPGADFERAADYLATLEDRLETAKQERYQEVGTPQEIGQRQGERRAREEAAYNASLPQGSQYDALRKVTDKPAQIESLYKNILGRDADPLGLLHYTTSGRSTAGISQDIANSPERRQQQQKQQKEQQLNALYKEVFNRDIDPSGLKTYTQDDPRAKDDITPEELASIKQDLFNSAEYKAKNPSAAGTATTGTPSPSPAPAPAPAPSPAPAPAPSPAPAPAPAPARAPAPAPAARNTSGRPSWAVLTPEEKAAEEFRNEEARINRMIQAKDLAKKAQEAGIDITKTP